MRQSLGRTLDPFLSGAGDDGAPQLIVTNQSEVNGVLIPTRMLYISPSRNSLGPHHSRSNSRSPSREPSQHLDVVTRVVQGHLMPIRDLNKGLYKQHYLEDPNNVLEKEFGVPQVNVHGDKQSKFFDNQSCFSLYLEQQAARVVQLRAPLHLRMPKPSSQKAVDGCH